MKKIALIIALTGILSSCGGDPVETLKFKISNQRKAIEKIEKKIDELNEELAKYDTSAVDHSKKVKVKVLKPELFVQKIELSGSVTAEKEAFISAEMGGNIKAIHVSEGDYVTAGQLLITLNTDAAAASVQALKTQLELATTMFEKQKKLFDQNIGSEVEFLSAKAQKEALEKNLKSAQAQYEMALIKAPFNGVVESIDKKLGEMAAPGYPIIHIVNLSQMKIYANVSEKYISSVKEGNSVDVIFPNYSKDKVHNLKIHRVGDVINKGSRTFRIEMKFTNANSQIKPNSMANIKINVYKNDSALVVPSIVVKKDINNNEFLFITETKNDTTLARKIDVTSGNSYDDNTEVSEGIKEGQKVIIQGFNMVSDGDILSIVE